MHHLQSDPDLLPNDNLILPVMHTHTPPPHPLLHIRGWGGGGGGPDVPVPAIKDSEAEKISSYPSVPARMSLEAHGG